MFEKSDQRFLQALDSPEEFEKRLLKLNKARKRMVIYIAVFFAFFIFLLLKSFELALRAPTGVIQSMILLLPFGFLFNLIGILIKEISIHSEIRTLLVFKKLRWPDS